MKNLTLIFAAAIVAVFHLPVIANDDATHPDKLAQVLMGSQRSEANKARDVYRHPFETLKFFGINENMTVIESWPGGGWYTEVLGPYLKDSGKLIAATYNRDPETQGDYYKRANQRYDENFVSHPEVFGPITVVGLSPEPLAVLAEPGSVDMVLDFRNAHNWIQKKPDSIVKAWYNALKPGGIVGIVDHRMDEGVEITKRNGYIHESTVIDVMERNGFKLDAKSELNANPKDTKDHPKGVWTLPPSLALGDEDRDKYLAIGESDRMVLKFVKP